MMALLSIFVVPLQAVGILPHNYNNNNAIPHNHSAATKSHPNNNGHRFLAVLRSFLMTCCACLLLLGIFFSSCIRTAHFLYDVLRRPDAAATARTVPYDNSDIMLKVIQLVPFAAVNWRAFVVLLLLFLRRDRWWRLTTQLDAFIHKVFASSAAAIIKRRAATFGAVLCVLSVVLHLTWEVEAWVVYLGKAYNAWNCI